MNIAASVKDPQTGSSIIVEYPFIWETCIAAYSINGSTLALVPQPMATIYCGNPTFIAMELLRQYRATAGEPGEAAAHVKESMGLKTAKGGGPDEAA